MPGHDPQDGTNAGYDEFRTTRRHPISTPGTRQERAAALEHTATRVALARIDRERRRLAAEEEWILSRPAEPKPGEDGDGPVIYFRKRFGDTNIGEGFGYQYVAVYVSGMQRWFVTGPRSPRCGGMAWLDLVDWIAKDELELPAIWLATDWSAVTNES